MADFVIGGGPFLGKKDILFRADLFLHDGAAAVTGKVNADFTKLLQLDGAADATAVTVTEVNAGTRPGVYTVTFTPTATGHFSIYVHEGNADGGQMWDIDVNLKEIDDLAGIQYDALGGATYDPDADELSVSAYLMVDGAIFAAPVEVDVTIFDSAGILFTLNSVTPDGDGVFWLTKAAPGLSEGKTHSAKIAIDDGVAVHTAIVPVLVQAISP